MIEKRRNKDWNLDLEKLDLLRRNVRLPAARVVYKHDTGVLSFAIR